MGYSKRMRMGGKRSFLSLCIVFCMIVSLLSTALATPAEAKSTRTAIIVETAGDVTVKKAGGSKSYTAYADMSLNQGDVIITGSDASAVLRIADHDDEITIDANAEINISDLSDQGSGKVSKLKMFVGSVWVKVKSLVSSEDEFEVQTPTAVMGVRGTNFWQGVDPVTGRTALVVASGIVRASTVTATDNEGTGRSLQAGKFVNVYPAQQIELDSRTETQDLKTKVETINISDLVNNASPKVIEKIIKGVNDIQQENAMLRQKLINDLNNGIQKPLDDSNLLIKDLADLNKVSSNFDNIVGNIAKQAIESKKLEKAQIDKIIEEANKSIEDPLKKLDLNKVIDIDPTAGLDPEVEQAKQAALEAQARFAEEQRQLIENQQRLASLLSKIEADKKAVDEANKKAAQEAADKAAEKLKSQLDDAARKAFEENQKKNEQQKTSNTGTPISTGGGGGSKDSDPVKPNSPVLISPAASLVTNYPVIVAKAAANAKIIVLNDGQPIKEAAGQGTAEVRIPLGYLPDGSYSKLTIVTEVNGLRSASVEVPELKVDSTMAITMKPEAYQPGVAAVKLYMNNLVDTKSLYAAEAHLVYSNALHYAGSNDISGGPDTVFGAQSQSAETLKEHLGSTENELIYAASKYESVTGTTSNFEVKDEQLLVTVPLNIQASMPSSVTQVPVKLVYYKVVNKNGNVVAEFNGISNPKEINVPVK